MSLLKMPIRKVTTLRKQLENPEASCGREILPTRLGRSKRAWWSRGPALEKFEQHIVPHIDSTLRNIGLGYADIYVRLYMIGIKQDSAAPMIMVCCSNSSVRSDAESAIRRSDVPRIYPEFGIGASALPLEQPVQARALGRNMYPDPVAFSAADIPSAVEYSPFRHPNIATSGEPKLGRKLFFVDGSCRPTRSATGGVIVQVHGRSYQLTVDHIQGTEEPHTPPHPSEDLEECHFDGQEEDDGEILTAFDYETTGRGSMTPVDRAGSWASSGSGAGESEISQDSSCFSLGEVKSPPGQPLQSGFDSPRPDGLQRENSIPATSSAASNIPRVADHCMSHASRSGEKPELDYALVSSDAFAFTGSVNEIDISQGLQRRSLQVERVSSISNEEKRIVTVTAYGGVLRGTLIPGPTHFRGTSASNFQRLYTIQLEGIVVEGDCGAAVVDERTGDLYGHIVRGCSGTPVAYIVPATEIFADLQARLGADISISSVGNRQYNRLSHHSLYPTSLFAFPGGAPSFPGPSAASSSTGPPRASNRDQLLPPAWETPPRFEDYNFSSAFKEYEIPGAAGNIFQETRSPSYVDPSLIHPDLRAPEIPYPHTFGVQSSSPPPAPALRQDSASPFVSFYPYDYSHETINMRRPSLVSFHGNGAYGGDEEGKAKQFCPFADCGKPFRDLKAHLLTHQASRPEKCPIASCDYHVKGFARKYDKNRHTLTHYKGAMACGFCPGAGSAAEKSFNRADVFKRHLTAVHGVEQTPSSSRAKRLSFTGASAQAASPSRESQGRRGKCSTCMKEFSNAQDLYDHLDECVLRMVQAEMRSEFEADEERNSTTLLMETSTTQESDNYAVDAEMDEDEDEDESSPSGLAHSPRGGWRRTAKRQRSASQTATLGRILGNDRVSKAPAAQRSSKELASRLITRGDALLASELGENSHDGTALPEELDPRITDERRASMSGTEGGYGNVPTGADI